MYVDFGDYQWVIGKDLGGLGGVLVAAARAVALRLVRVNTAGLLLVRVVATAGLVRIAAAGMHRKAVRHLLE